MKRKSTAPVRFFELWRSPIGWIGLVAGQAGLATVVSHPSEEEVRGRISIEYPQAAASGENDVLAVARLQLEEYFRGERHDFDLPLDLSGLPPFTAAVLRRLVRVPYGTTVTYGELAAAAGSPGAARAVGRAMAINPLPLVIPCHRVLGTGGKMTGYSGGEGIATKEWLLDHERRQV
jgi:methylated-DNA-[protein]-cysteine S-methyltransferase